MSNARRLPLLARAHACRERVGKRRPWRHRHPRSFGCLGLSGSTRVLAILAPRQLVVIDPRPPEKRPLIPTDSGAPCPALQRHSAGRRHRPEAATASCRTPRRRCAVFYTDRGDFPEYPIMVAVCRWLPAVFASNEDLLAGESQSIDAVRAMPSKAPPTSRAYPPPNAC